MSTTMATAATPATPTRWICASSRRGAGSINTACSRFAGSTSNASPTKLEDRGKSRATVARRLCTIVGFYRYAEEEGVIEHSPAVHIRRPRVDHESHVAHLDRNELGSILVTAGLSSPRDHALVSLLALNGLRVSEAIGANIEALGLNAGIAP